MYPRTLQGRVSIFVVLCTLVILLLVGFAVSAKPAAAARTFGAVAAAPQATVTSTPTPARVTTATSTAAGPKATVKGATLNVRGGPGTTFPVIAAAKKGESFEITGKNTNDTWLQVCCFKGKPGWVSASLVTVTGSLKAVPVPKDLPTPPPPAAAPAAKSSGKLGGVLLYSVLN